MLAAVPGLYVLTTVRDDTYRRHPKAFHLLALIQPFADDAHLTAIYQRHVDLYYDGDDPFAGAFVDEAARRSGGRIGVFLGLVRDAFTLVPPARLADLELGAWVRGEWRQLAEAEPVLAGRLTEAVRRGGLLGADSLDLLRPSSLMRWVLEDYTSDRAARIHPVLHSLLNEDAAARSTGE